MWEIFLSTIIRISTIYRRDRRGRIMQCDRRSLRRAFAGFGFVEMANKKTASGDRRAQWKEVNGRELKVNGEAAESRGGGRAGGYGGAVVAAGVAEAAGGYDGGAGWRCGYGGGRRPLVIVFLV